MKFVQRKATCTCCTTAQSKEVIADFKWTEEVISCWCCCNCVHGRHHTQTTVVLNWDQTGVKIIPSSMWTMERQGAKRAEMVGVNDKDMYVYDKDNWTDENVFVLMII